MPAHVKSCLMGPSLTIPIQQGRLGLGTWQVRASAELTRASAAHHGFHLDQAAVHAVVTATLRTQAAAAVCGTCVSELAALKQFRSTCCGTCQWSSPGSGDCRGSTSMNTGTMGAVGRSW